jgi:hypothetical protein
VVGIEPTRRVDARRGAHDPFRTGSLVVWSEIQFVRGWHDGLSPV